MTRNEQEEYVRDHPHTDMVPNAKNTPLHNPDRSRSVELLKKIRSKQREIGTVPKTVGVPAAATDLVKHLDTLDDPESKDFLQNVKKTWDAFSSEYSGKISNPKLFGMWSQHMKSSFPKDILKIRDKLKDDRSPSARNALQSIDSILSARQDFGSLTHAAQISREFTKIALEE